MQSCFAILPCSLAESTLHDLQLELNKGRIVTELDPDAPSRQKKRLSEFDEVKCVLSPPCFHSLPLSLTLSFSHSLSLSALSFSIICFVQKDEASLSKHLFECVRAGDINKVSSPDIAKSVCMSCVRV